MLQNLCRICANDVDKTKALTLFKRNTRLLLRHINILTGLLLKRKPNMPELICEECQSNLKSAIEFRKRCLSIQKKWEQQPVEKENVNSPPSAHRTCMRRSSRKRSKDDSEMPFPPCSPVEVLIKVEHHSDAEFLDLDPVAVTNDSAEFAKYEAKMSTEASMSADESSEAAAVKSNTDKTKKSQNRASTKTPRQPRGKPTLPVFFCDQCGNNITGKSSFDRHVRKHANIRPYQCKLCPARFLSAGELKGHQVMHTGDRNFPCRYCERTYVNYSGRLRHERTHTNERPFVCATCGKTFTNSYILKNHMLVHTGERLFRCDLCARSFSRPTHLKTHYRSNTHKQNVEKARAQQPQSSTTADSNDVLTSLGSALPNLVELPAAQLLGPAHFQFSTI